MYIELTKNNGTDYLRLVENRRITNDKGIRTSTKKVVFNIGPLSRFDDGKPDYVKRLKKSYKNGKPLIDSLIPYIENKESKTESVNISFTQGDSNCFGKTQCFAPCILGKVFSSLGLDQLFATLKYSSKIDYDLQGIVRLLIYGRLLFPASKMETMKMKDDFYPTLVKSVNDDNVYDALSMIYENRHKIFRRMNSKISNGIGRDTEQIYYDVTNFFFEIEKSDED